MSKAGRSSLFNDIMECIANKNINTCSCLSMKIGDYQCYNFTTRTYYTYKGQYNSYTSNLELPFSPQFHFGLIKVGIYTYIHITNLSSISS